MSSESAMPSKGSGSGANLRGATVSATGAGTLYQRRESKTFSAPKSTRDKMDMTETEEDTETEVHDTDGGILSKSQGPKNLKSAKDRNAKSTLPEANATSTVLEADRPLAAKLQTFKVRALWTVLMIIFFAVVIYAGHMYCSLLCVAVTMGIYREILRIKRNFEKEENIPLFFFLRWYFFACTMFSAGVKWLTPLLESVADKYKPVRYVLNYNSFLTFIAAVFGFVLFVLSLRKYTLRYQFRQLAWIVVTLLVVVVQSSSQIANIYSGLIWFLLPTSLVIVNDIFAYIFGVLFGKTRLIALSPKKTWEGFLGAFFVTILWSGLLTSFLSQYKPVICPQETVTFRPFDWTNDCTPSHIYVARPWELPETVASIIGVDHVTFAPVLLHAAVLGAFAAVIAPFGGFFASGFKRAFKIKDFGDSIPGHGGITDRFDCQIMMGMFTYMYLRSFVWASARGESFGHIYASVMALEGEDQIRIYTALKETLAAQNLI
eukprot:GDKI01015400.1.p1 GENE.GDKI01015400.1~~GDKI01015400.1.p1  ORF type:complete len:528 (+),score=110.82 GDKI01015400.1:117-1586(+)